MVGVPGRSNACHTCKKRKKKCDEQQPNCGRCNASGTLCEGYSKPLIFINSGQKHARTKKGRFASNKYSPLPLVDPQGRNHDIGWPARLRKPESLLEQSLESSAWESKYFEVYWTSLLPNGQVFTPRAAQYSTAGWSSVVQDLCHQDSLVRQTLLANALGLVGHHSGQHSVVMAGWRAYGRSLHMLSQSLSNTSQGSHDKIFATAAMLKQFQLLESTKAQSESTPAANWLKHAPGEQAIIVAKPPSHYAQGHAHRLFADTRLNLLYLDIQNRKRSTFSSPVWKSDPWATSTKDPKDELLDVLVEIPGLLEDFDSFLASSPKQEKRYRRLRYQMKARCSLYDDQLEWWAATSGASTLTLVEEIISTKVDQNKASSSVDLAMAHLGMVYWSTCILLYYPLWTLADTMHEQLPERMNPRRYCRKIALLMPYFFALEVGEFFINMAGFPAVVALRCLARMDPAQQASEERELFLKSFSTKRGHQLRNFLKAWPGRSDCVVDYKGANQGPCAPWQRIN